MDQQQSHFERLIEQEREHHKQNLTLLKSIIRSHAVERDRYRDLWMETRGKVFEKSTAEQTPEPPLLTQSQEFEQWHQSLNADEQMIFACWVTEQIEAGHEERELPALWMKSHGTNSPLLELTV